MNRTIFERKINGKKFWYYQYKDTITGKYKQVRITDCNSREEAMDIVEGLPDFEVNQLKIKNISDGLYDRSSSFMIRNQLHGRKLCDESLKAKKRFLRYVQNIFGERDITSLREMDVDGYLCSVQKSGSWKNSFIGVLSDIFEEAIYLGIPLRKLVCKSFSRNSRKSDIFNSSELRLIFNEKNFASRELYLFWLLCVTGGLRVSEVRAVRPCQLIIEKKALVVDGFITRSYQRTNYNKCGSDEKPKYRVVFLPEKLMLELENLIVQNNIKDDELIFKRKSKAFTMRYCEGNLQRAINRAGINRLGKKFTPHSFRYTYVTLLRNNVTADVVQKLAGHNSLEMTEYYTRKNLNDNIEALLFVQKHIEETFGDLIS